MPHVTDMLNRHMIACVPEKDGYTVIYSCGHTAWWTVKPPANLSLGCVQCLRVSK